METPRHAARAGVTLIEVCVAVAVLAAVGIALVSALGTGSRHAATAGEAQLAALIGAQAMDWLTGGRYRGLAGRAGTEEALDLGRLAAGPEETGPAGALIQDGVEFHARLGVTEPEDGLLRLELVLDWGKPGAGRPQETRLVRFVADPDFEGR